MIIPDKFKFHTTTDPDFIYSVEYDSEQDNYQIRWTGGDASMKSIIYSRHMIESSLRRFSWKLTDIQTNEEALALLNHD